MKKLLLSFAALLIVATTFAQTRTITATVPNETIVCYIAGSLNGWNTSSTQMTEIPESNPKQFTYTFEMSDTDLADLKFKVLAGPEWTYEQTSLDDQTSLNVTIDAFKAIFNPNVTEDVTITVLVPKTVFVCYLTGSFNNWNSQSHEMTFVEETPENKIFELEVTVPDKSQLEFKVLAGPGWPFGPVNESNIKYSDIEADGFVEVTEFKSIFDPNKAGDITINITVPAGTVEAWIVGSYNGWDLTNSIKATKNTDGTFSGIIPSVQAVDYKIFCSNTDWKYGEIVAADRKATFDPEGTNIQNITVDSWENMPTAIENTLDNAYIVSISNNTIIVTGNGSDIEIYNTLGHRIQKAVFNSTFTSKPLANGVYIVRIDGKSRKISVR